MSDIELIEAADAPAPGGHYSPAVVHDGLVYVSGQLGARPDGSHAADAPFEMQAEQALHNLASVLRAAGSSPGQVLKVTAFIVGVENWGAFNRLFAAAFGTARPARSVVPVSMLHHGYLIEIEAIASCGSPRAG